MELAEFKKTFADAWSCFQSGRLDEAEGLLNRILAGAPRSSQALVALGQIAAAKGDLGTAIERMQRVLKSEPGNPAAIEWLASLSMQVGDMKQAEAYAKEGLKHNPQIARLYKVLGQCCVERTEFDTALDLFTKASRLDPTDAEAVYAQGTVLRKLHRVGEALAALQHAGKMAPQALLELADLQAILGRREEAVETLARSLTADPSSFRALTLMARLRNDLKQLEEAEQFWNKAEANEPIAGEARLFKATNLATNGRFEEAEQEISRSIEINPYRGRAYYVLFASRRATGADLPRIEKMSSLAVSGYVHGAEQIDLLFAIGKAQDNLGDYQQAIQSFDRANALVRKVTFGGRPFDRAALKRSIDLQIELIGNKPDITNDETPTPLFVLGMPRSGTTLVDQILTCHPEVGSVGEQSFWLEYEGSAIDYERRKVRGEQAERLGKLYTDLLGALAPSHPLVVDKNPANLFEIGLISSLFPSSKIVCTQRNPVDTALSIWTTRMYTEAPFVADRDAIVFAIKECKRLTDACRAQFTTDRYHEVRYESLIDNVEQETRKMLAFVGLPWNDACLHPDRNVRSIGTPSFWQVRQPIYRSSVDRWKIYEPWLGPFAELIDC